MWIDIQGLRALREMITIPLLQIFYTLLVGSCVGGGGGGRSSRGACVPLLLLLSKTPRRNSTRRATSTRQVKRGRNASSCRTCSNLSSTHPTEFISSTETDCTLGATSVPLIGFVRSRIVTLDGLLAGAVQRIRIWILTDAWGSVAGGL